MPYPTGPQRKPKVDGAAATNLMALVLGGTTTPTAPAKPKKEGPKGRNSNWSVGMRGENRTANELKRQGYRCTLSHMSQGLADVVATPGDGAPVMMIRYIQVKTTGAHEYTPTSLNQKIRDLFGLGKYDRAPNNTVSRPEAWLWIGRDDPKLAAVAVVNPDWTVTVTGEKAEEVQTAINQMLARGPQRRARRNEPTTPLIERLTGDKAA